MTSVKGAQGGYMLASQPRNISVYRVLSAVENSLIESAEETVAQKAPQIDAAMRSLVFGSLDTAVEAALEKITLDDLVHEAEKHNAEHGLMFFI